MRGAALCLALWAVGPALAQQPLQVAELSSSPDALFKEVFGRAPPARPRAIPLELEVDGQPAGWVSTLLPSGKGDTRPQAAPVLKALGSVLREEAHAQLAAEVDAHGYLSLQALEALGLTATFEPARLSIRIAVPPRLRRTSTHTVASRAAPPPASEVSASSRVSGFLNLRLAQDLSWAHGREAPPERQPLRLGVESAVNVDGWVLEGRGELAEGTTGWSRGDVRLVRDFTGPAVRFVAGDLAAPGTGFTPGRSLFGLSAARHFSLDPTLQVLPEEAVGFVLERPSKVEVFVNGRLVQTLQLQAGPQDLRGMLLDLGSNELELVITDDLGAQQRVTKRVGLASGQLAPGVSEFAYSLGFPLQPGAPGRTHDWSRPTLHLVHRQGLSRALTLGGSLQADPVTQGLGLEQQWATYWGSVSGTAALSHSAGTLGYATGLRYELRRSGGSGLSTLGLGGEYRSEAFTLPGELPSERPTYALNASWGQSFGTGLHARLSLEARAQGVDPAPGYVGTLSVTQSFRSGLALMLDTTARLTAGGARELRGRLNLVWAWPDARRSVHALTEVGTTTGPSGQLTVNQQLSTGSTTVHASAGVAHDASGSRVSESLTYRGQRAEAEVSHRMVGPANARGALESVVQTRVGMAVVFADGLFALSRPVTSSFAIVVPNDALRGQWIGVNPGVQGYAAAVDGLGPAVLPDLQPYTWSTLRVAAPELPVGYSLGDDTHSLRPSYRNGTVVRVGEEGSVILRGVLRDEKDTPVSLGAGSIVRLAEVPEEPVPFFTNRTGRFVIPTLTPGQYLLRIDGTPLATRFTIPEDAAGMFELGHVKLVAAANDAALEGVDLVAREVAVTRRSEAVATAGAAPREPAATAPATVPVVAAVTPAPAPRPSTVHGRLFGDRNANATWDVDEPVFAGVRVQAAGVRGETDEEGLFELQGVTGTEVVLRVEDPGELPFGMVPAERRVALGAAEVSVDLLAPAARVPMAPRGPFEVPLAEGRVRVTQLEKATFPLVAWVAGLPLSATEARRLERLAERVHGGRELRLLVVARAQTQGSLRGAVKRALNGARALQRYLQATQFIPAAKVALTVVEPLPGLENPLGSIDLVLVRVEPPG